MALRIKKYDNINGFDVIEDKGRIGRHRPGIASCKLCNKNFECNLYGLKRIKSCGCANKRPLCMLEKYINGFKVIEDLGRVGKARRVKFECKVCGNLSHAQVQNLKTASSCGCLRGKPITCKYRKEFKRLFRIYINMNKRCSEINHKSFKNYGARGIQVCKEWKESPDVFCEWALENGYEDHLTIDRIDNNLNYGPSNCRWATVIEQHRNTRSNVLNEEMVRLIKNEYRKNMTVIQIAEKYGLKRLTVSAVIHNYCWKDIL